jgi:hypothetical protein
LGHQKGQVQVSVLLLVLLAAVFVRAVNLLVEVLQHLLLVQPQSVRSCVGLLVLEQVLEQVLVQVLLLLFSQPLSCRFPLSIYSPSTI